MRMIDDHDSCSQLQLQTSLAKFLVKLIQPLPNKNKTRITNTKSFVEVAKTWHVDREAVQVSYNFFYQIHELENAGPIGGFCNSMRRMQYNKKQIHKSNLIPTTISMIHMHDLQLILMLTQFSRYTKF